MVDEGTKGIVVIRNGIPDVVVAGEMEWKPLGAAQMLVFGVALLFV